jgi:hypothetical protein
MQIDVRIRGLMGFYLTEKVLHFKELPDVDLQKP